MTFLRSGFDGITAPTLSASSTGYTSQTQTVTISNWSSYSRPTTWCTVLDSGGAVVTAPAAVTDNEDGTLTVPMPAVVGTYTIQVKILQFGTRPSAAVEHSIVLSALPAARYWRLTGFADHTGSALFGYGIGVERLRYWTGLAGTGTQYPAAMTGNSAPSPYVASASFSYSASYGPFKAFDRLSYGHWWLLGRTGAQQLTDWLQIDLGVAQAIQSVWVDFLTAGNFPTNGLTVVLQRSSDAITWSTVTTTVVASADAGGSYLL